MTSALHGTIDRLRSGMPVTVEAVEEIARVLRLLQGQGWSGFITADEGLQVIIDGNDRREARIQELERDLANASKVHRLLLDQLQPDVTKRQGYGERVNDATRVAPSGETASPGTEEHLAGQTVAQRGSTGAENSNAASVHTPPPLDDGHVYGLRDVIVCVHPPGYDESRCPRDQASSESRQRARADECPECRSRTRSWRDLVWVHRVGGTWVNVGPCRNAWHDWDAT